MNRSGLIAALLCLLAIAGPARAALKPLQPLIDAAAKGETVMPPPGVYAGPVVIRKAITLDGRGKVTIDNAGEGTVVTVATNGATVRGLRLINSGDQHNDIDAGIRVKGKFNVIKDNVIEESLFGIDLQQSSNNVVRRNRISSRSDASLGVKGDAIRLWYSFDNKIENNIITRSRDLVVWYSANNRIAGNKISFGRYGLHFMYSKYNLVENNNFHMNSVGIFIMYSDSVVIRGNRVFHALGAAGMGIGLKESSDCIISDNKVYYNGTGLYLDNSPWQPDTKNRIYRNSIAFNSLGVVFLNDWVGNIFTDNIFRSNIRHVSVSTFAGANRNVWEANYWDDYEGFDRDGDGFGDTPYVMRVYADRLWMDVPYAAYFIGSPVLTTLDFLERLAPFTRPLIMLEDKEPRLSSVFTPRTKRKALDTGVTKKTIKLFGGVARAGDSDTAGTQRLDPFGIYKGDEND